MFFKLDKDAAISFRATPGSAGVHGKFLVNTGIRIWEFPESCYGRLADVGAGVVDDDYAGEVRFMMFNLNDKERVAQLIFEKYHKSDKVYAAYFDSNNNNNLCKWVVQDTSKKQHNVRGASGFGSKGTTTLLAPSDVKATLNGEVLEIKNVEELDDDYTRDYDYDDEDGYVIDTDSDSGTEDNGDKCRDEKRQRRIAPPIVVPPACIFKRLSLSSYITNNSSNQQHKQHQSSPSSVVSTAEKNPNPFIQHQKPQCLSVLVSVCLRV